MTGVANLRFSPPNSPFPSDKGTATAGKARPKRWELKAILEEL
jgi:hypothetical protein